jgi:Domain of unknown function (DUF222)
VFDTHLAAVTAARTPADGVRACARLENAACAARLGHIADLLAAAHCADGSADREQWRLDNWAAVCAQIGAAHDVTSGVANALLTDAVVLRERLPQLGAVFATGTISYRLVHLICSRTMLVTDPDGLQLLDAELAFRVSSCGAMSKDQAEKTVDALVLILDPFAVHRTQTRARGHHVDVHVDDASGTAEVEASVSVTDGHAFDKRLDALARTVCDRDPRTKDGLRAAAVGAMAFGWDRIPCLCDSPDCDATIKPSSGGIVIHLIAPHDAIDTDAAGGTGGPEPDSEDDTGNRNGAPSDEGDPGPQDPEPDDPAERAADNAATASDPDIESNSTATGSDPEASVRDPKDAAAGSEPEPELESEPPPEPTREPAPDAAPTPAAPPVGDLATQRRGLIGKPPPLLPTPWHSYTWSALTAAINADRGQLCPARPGVILGGPLVPAPVIAQAARYATIRTLIHPGQAPPEPRYRPSTTLADFVKCRDLTCRFPGCTRPATITDMDHTVPHPWGPTAPSDLACLCREHHLLKTFWPGWSNRQGPDGDVVWTDPDGHTYTTQPGSRLLFPELSAPTATVTVRGTPPPKHTAGLTMPRRTTTRSQARHQRVKDERRQNIPAVAKHLRESIPPF